MKKSDMRKMLAMMMENKAEVIFGVPPIVTSKKKLLELKAFGGTEQNGTPTPDNPVDIVCNNGVLKTRHQSGLPLGYTLLDYIESSGTQYIDTGISDYKNTNVLKIKIRPSQVSKTMFVTYQNPSSGLNNMGLFVSSSFLNYQYGSLDRIRPLIAANTDYVIEAGNGFLVLNGNSYTGELNPEFTVGNRLLIGAVSADSRLFQGRIYYYHYEDENGNILFDGIPAKDSNDVIGLYDTVSGQFFTNQGTGDFVAGETVDDIEVYADGTVETINVHGKNLLNPNNIHQGTIVTATGYVGYAPNRCYFDYIPVRAGDTIWLSVKNNTPPPYNIYFYTEQNEDSYEGVRPITSFSFGDYSGRKTTAAKDGYIRAIFLQSENFTTADVIDAQFVIQNSAPTEYEPYYDGGTATAEMLLKVGDYTDVQEILSGAVTRKVGVKVLDGTETISYFSSSNRIAVTIPGMLARKVPVLCNQFKTGNTGDYYVNAAAANNYLYLYNKDCNSKADYVSFLATQYNAGTPVIVVYPLATPTTETVLGQTLTLTSGTNVIDITQASLNNLELEVKVK